MDLKTFAYKVRGATPFDGLILAFDPGETTGFTAMSDFQILEIGQAPTKPGMTFVEVMKNLEYPFLKYLAYHGAGLPAEVAIEDYRVYDWKAESHSWSQVHTIKVVGFLQYLCEKHGLRYTMRMAATAKGFCTDDKLWLWDLYDPTVGKKHARDALRHACFHSIWPRKVDK